MTKILIVEDEKPIANLIDWNLSASGYSCTRAYDGLTAADLIAEHSYDLVLLDIMLPGIDGYELLGQIKPTGTPVIFITAKGSVQDRVQGLRAGADDYLAKPFSHGELLMKVDSLIRRYRVYKGKVTGKQLKSDVVLDEENRRILRGGEALELTETEFSILQFLADHRGSVVSVAQIYEGVWHEKYMPASNNTVMVHIVNLRKKLEDDPANPRLIRTIWGKGYQID